MRHKIYNCGMTPKDRIEVEKDFVDGLLGIEMKASTNIVCLTKEDVKALIKQLKKSLKEKE